MSYPTLAYAACFLPIVIIVYQAVPAGIRKYVLLASGCLFFCLLSGPAVVYLFAAVMIAHHTGIWIQNIDLNRGTQTKKATAGRKKAVSALGIVLLLAVLFMLKYYGWVSGAAAPLLRVFHADSVSPVLSSAVLPVGLSYYTLMAISYISDVCSGRIEAEASLADLALYLCFFPTLLEGPIARYDGSLRPAIEGKPVSKEDLKRGYLRILWGMFQELVVADYLYFPVTRIFKSYTSNGTLCFLGAILYTLQLYADFAGTIDIVIGSARIFGVRLPENFRQPFFAKNASDFWRRWHITLGTFLRDYIFYPVSLSRPNVKLTKAVKTRFGREAGMLAGSVVPLFLVWLSNGLWHGPRINYVLYGLYYFCLILAELILEKPLLQASKRIGFSLESTGFRIFRFLKLMIIVSMGEMLFRADDLQQAGVMFKSILFRPKFSEAASVIMQNGLDLEPAESVTLAFGIAAIVTADILKEKKKDLYSRYSSHTRVVRWSLIYAAVAVIVLFGEYGSGFDAAGMIYAGF
ncbi:MAG: MBOAT family protein [Lachnospiraceae bacterium]|nr:MBOAT family protein [Lachnospiraceae bacterium]